MMKDILNRISDLVIPWLSIQSLLLRSLIFSFVSKPESPVQLFDTIKELDTFVVPSLVGRGPFENILCPAENISFLLEGKAHEKTHIAPYILRCLKGTKGAISPHLLVLALKDIKGKRSTHITCAYWYRTKYLKQVFAHFGNWGHFKGYTTLASLVNHIATMSNSKLIAYGIADEGLKLLYYEKVR